MPRRAAWRALGHDNRSEAAKRWFIMLERILNLGSELADGCASI
jgi:hypothetical protein